MSEPTVAVVIPAWEAADLLPEVLAATRVAFDGAVVCVVDAGSRDDTARVAEAHGAEVVRLRERAGPAHARNVGVAHVDADVVAFLDADCVPHGDVGRRVREAFAADPELVCLCGSYDARPRDRGFFSQYMNLRHHWTHQHAAREQATFWAGCAAVRREAFLAVGGFDAGRYPRPQIEDIELGYRLREKGRTRLDPEMQATHLKRWTLASVVRTDVCARALPWTALLRERGGLPNDLNLRTSQRAAALLAPFALLSLVALPAAGVAGEWPAALGAAAVLAASLWLQRRFVRDLSALRGPGFAARAWLFHQLHLVYSALAFAYGWLRGRA